MTFGFKCLCLISLVVPVLQQKLSRINLSQLLQHYNWCRSLVSALQ